MVFKILETVEEDKDSLVVVRGIDSSYKETSKKRKEKLPAFEQWLLPNQPIYISNAYKTSGFRISKERPISKDIICIIELRSLEEKLTNPKVYIQDPNNKPSTLVNEEKLEKGKEFLCEDNTSILVSFSKKKITLRIEEVPIVISGSSKASDFILYKRNYSKFGIDFTTECNNSCSHLLMSDFKVTLKLFQFLAFQKPIINSQWIKETVNWIQQEGHTELPDIKDHLPKINKNTSSKIPLTNLASLLPDSQRSLLFRGIAGFTFPGAESELITSLVTNCGGEISEFPFELSDNSSKSFATFVSQENLINSSRRAPIIIFEPSPSEALKTFASDIQNDKNLSRYCKSIGLAELCQMILYKKKPDMELITDHNASSDKTLKSTLSVNRKANPNSVSQIDSISTCGGTVYNARRNKQSKDQCVSTFSSDSTTENSQVPKTRQKIESLVVNPVDTNTLNNHKRFKKNSADKSSSQVMVPRIIQTVPIYEKNSTKEAEKKDSFDSHDNSQID